MIDFIKNYGALIVAFAALARPELRALWRKWFRQGKIDIHKTGHIEIGFDRFGPTIALLGTLQSIHEDLFVYSIELEVIRDKASSKHRFEWGVFQPYGITVGGEPAGLFEVPYGFIVPQVSPHRYSVRFYDKQDQSDLLQILDDVSLGWRAVITKTFKPNELALISIPNSASGPAFEEVLTKLWLEYSNSALLAQSYDKLSRMCYWESGTYTLRIVVRVANPLRSFEKSWDFTLTENETQLIRSNIIKVLQYICERPVWGRGYFAYARYG
jgi:hypothetical protein